MPSVGSASLDLVVDKQQVGRSIQGAVQGNDSKIKGMGKSLATTFFAGFAAFKAADLIGDAINGARDLAENQSKVNTVFKDMGPAITQYAKGADAIGLTDNAALQALGTFGNMFDQLKIGSKESAKMSTGMVDLAADLGSFHNADITDVIDSMTSAFRGEYDAVQRFIPTINAAAVEQRALADTHKKTTKELTAQDKAIAVQKLLLEGAGAAAGDFDRTSGGLANSQRVLGARWEELKTGLGQRLLPVITKVTSFLAKNLPKAMDQVTNSIGNLIAGFKGGESEFVGPFAAGLYDFGQTVRTVWDKYLKSAVAWLKDNWKTALKIAGAAFLLFTGPVTFVVVSLALLYTRFKSVREGIAATADFFRTKLIPAVQAAASWITEKFGQVVAWFKSMWPQVSEAVSHVMNVVKDVIKGVTNTVAALWRAWGDDLLRIVKTIWNFISETVENALQFVKGVIRFVLAVINGDWGRAWDALKSIVGAIWDQIGNVISTGIGLLRGIITGALFTIQEVWNGVWGGLAGVVDSIWVGIQNSVRNGVNVIIDGINLLIRAMNLIKPGKDIGEIGHIATVQRAAGHSGFGERNFGGNGLNLRAHGGDYSGLTLVGERGPELRADRGHIVSNQAIRAAVRGGSGSRGGITVNAYGVVGDVHAVGRYLTDTLERHYGNGGAKPRGTWAA